jgi:hypothetical protein
MYPASDALPAIVDNSLIGCYNFKNPNSYMHQNKTLNNIAPNGNKDAKFMEASDTTYQHWSYSENEGSAKFDGTTWSHFTSSINPFGYLGPYEKYTFCAWVKINEYPGPEVQWFSRFLSLKTNYGDFDACIQIGGYYWDYGLEKRFAVSTGQAGVTSLEIYSPTDYLLNKWYYVCGVFDGLEQYTVNLYVDGVKVEMGEYSWGAVDSSTSFGGMVIGCEYYEGAPYYYSNVNIARIHLYNRVLSDEEIMSNYQKDKDIFSGLGG